MENPIYIEMAEDLETCIEELSSIVGVVKICDAHLKDDPDTALSTASSILHKNFTSVYKRLDALQIRLYKYRVNKNT
ncbi:MAG: hypothetical protein EAZ77_00005 [Nostocales cyanobacterium]|nr:MAG: hypothetical protein EAZ77_00005 [Nostocales cyanobacterium]